MEKRKSSINIQQVKYESWEHNHRQYTPNYAIDEANKNEYYNFVDDSYKTEVTNKYGTYTKVDFEKIKNLVNEKYTKSTGQKPQQKQQVFKEAVINTDQHITQEHFLKLNKMLKDKYNLTVLDITHHKDEGYVDKNGIKHKNYHAHVVFLNVDWTTGKTVRIDKNTVRQLQTDVAIVMEMERGIDKRISKVQRMEHKQYKQHIQQINELKEKNEELQKELNETKKVLKLTKLINNDLQKQKNEMQELFESLGLNEIKQQTSDITKIKKMLLESLARDYNNERDKLKQSQQATQQQYSELKKDNDNKKELINEAFKKQLTKSVSNNNIVNKNNKGFEPDL